MTSPQHAARVRLATLGFCLGIPFLFALAAAILPQDNNWDLRNYHWYNAYAFLTGRMGFDLAPAQTPTYYNPLLDVPFYLAAQVLPARVLSFLLGLVQGCNFIPLFFLARRTLALPDALGGVCAAAVIALVGLIGAGHIGMIGATFYDNVLSLFVLGAVLMIVGAPGLLTAGPMKKALSYVFVAGALVGLAVGLKLPSQVFAVGMCFGLLFISGPFMRRFWLSFVSGLGIIAGFAVTGGWWIARMWQTFANPLFPYMNDVFRSPWVLEESYRDIRFLPKSLGEALTFPFRFVADSKIASEISFTDWRIAVAVGALIITGVFVLAGRKARTPGADIFAVRYLAAVATLSYVVWLAVFAIYRYITPLEMLAPLLTVAAVALWPLPLRARALVAGALLLFVTVTVRVHEDWTRKPWAPGLGGPFVDVTAPVLEDPNTLILMTGLAPTAFVIPAFPPDVPFLRPVSYLAGPDHDTLFIQTVKQRLEAHTGPVLVLQPSWDHDSAAKFLPMLSLAPDHANCRKLPNALDDTLELCPVRKLP
ncbi:MAG: hypothetical protein AB7I36_01125 [Rhodospirillaceae bacterium]